MCVCVCGCVCVCVYVCFGGEVKLRGERTHVDKPYGHQSGPPHSMPKSVVPLIIRGSELHTLPHLSNADRFTQRTFCFGGLRES